MLPLLYQSLAQELNRWYALEKYREHRNTINNFYKLVIKKYLADIPD
jgi:hypothetical protein